MNRAILILTGLMTAKVVAASMDVATGHSVFTLGPVEMIVLVQVLMALAGGMPHPETLKTMGMSEFLYTWLFNSANIIFQNLEKRYHPQPDQGADKDKGAGKSLDMSNRPVLG